MLPAHIWYSQHNINSINEDRLNVKVLTYYSLKIIPNHFHVLFYSEPEALPKRYRRQTDRTNYSENVLKNIRYHYHFNAVLCLSTVAGATATFEQKDYPPTTADRKWSWFNFQYGNSRKQPLFIIYK